MDSMGYLNKANFNTKELHLFKRKKKANIWY